MANSKKETVTHRKERDSDELNANARPVKLQLRPGAVLQPKVAEWIADIIEGKQKWSKESIEARGEDFKNSLQTICTIGMSNLILNDLDKFETNMAYLFNEDTKRGLWDINHNKIITAISNLTAENNRFPTRSELSSETSLSRVTINRHLKHYYQSPEHQERQEDFVIMRERVLATAFKYAKNGDMKAAKVFLDATANQSPATTIKNQQNNFIQINGTTITEDQLKELPEAQQEQLRVILNTFTNKAASFA